MKPFKNNNPLINNADGGMGIRVQPRDSVPSAEIANNARENLTLFPKDCWLKKAKIHNETAWLVSAGPSLKHLLSVGYLRKEWFHPPSQSSGAGNKLFTVKHALPVLNKFGISPHFCVVLDPRPIQGVSTHGFVRQTLYSHAPKSTKFLVASMTHPSVTKWLIRNGYEVYGWHSAANGLVTPKDQLDKGVLPGPLQDQNHFVQGGTCSATRSISLAHFMGFRKANLIAFDSNLADKPTDPEYVENVDGTQVKKYWQTRIGNSKPFWTTGELIAQIQDLQNFLSFEFLDVECKILGADKGTSLVGALNEVVENKTIRPTYESMVGEWKINQ